MVINSTEQNSELLNNQTAPSEKVDTSLRRLKYFLVSLIIVIFIEIIAIIVFSFLQPNSDSGRGGDVPNDSTNSSSTNDESGQETIDSDEARDVNTMDEIVAFCEKNNLVVMNIDNNSLTQATETIQCDNEYLAIGFAVFDQPFEKIHSIEEISGSLTNIEKNENYSKYYGLMSSEISEYVIVSGNTLLIVLGDEDEARQAIIELGWPDRNWGDKSEASMDVETIEKLKNSSYDSERRNRIAYIDTSLVQYQTNNMGKLPEGSYYWHHNNGEKCKNRENSACAFIEDYVFVGQPGSFTDPDGSQFGFYYTENLYDNDEVTRSFGGASSYLIEKDGGYTIGGGSPFNEHVIYIIPGGQCNANDDGIVKGERPRLYAIMYMLESGSVICTDNS